MAKNTTLFNYKYGCIYIDDVSSDNVVSNVNKQKLKIPPEWNEARNRVSIL